MTLEDKDIIEIDATVTTGILILLTFSLIGSASDVTTLAHIEFELSIRIGLTAIMLLPFVTSAIILLVKKEGQDDRVSYSQIRMARKLTATGFGLIPVILFFFFIIVAI